MTRRNLLFGQFEVLANSLSRFKLEGNYGPSMQEFFRDLSWAQEWDIPALLPEAQALGAEDVILDLGTGDGRILYRLLEHGVKARMTGIDNSTTMQKEFSQRMTDQHPSAAFFLQSFFNLDAWADRVALAVFGCVSVNCLIHENELKGLFDSVKVALRFGGLFAIAVYTDQAATDLHQLDGVLAADVYTSEGGEQVAWRGMRVRNSLITHNAYFAPADIDGAHVLCADEERVWKESEVLKIAEGLGWVLRRRGISSVGDGGAEGAEVATLFFAPPMSPEA